MAYVETLLDHIKDLRLRKEFKILDKTSKRIADYLLSETEETAKKGLLPMRKRVSKQYNIHLFSMRFAAYGGVYVSTLHKFGAAHIACIKECKTEEIEDAIKAIATVCEILHWDIEVERQNVKSSDRTVEIFAEIPEGATP